MIAITPATHQLAPKVDERARLTEAAQRFEAIFARQMLAAARQTSFGDSLFDSQGNEIQRS